ncbi:MAG: CehA/McbA family metallohydrolase [Gemmataceae bacterium]|nr:CehA/McbA family metallohydrolase [Gemmataceae bacterium]MCI0742235.1 CehA/McbA family metallohydrolase [Gemmataceae bacterium]
MRVPFVFISIGALCLCGATQEQTPRLTGEIIDAETHKPLPARIYVQGADGAWHFPRSQAPAGSAIPYKKQRADQPKSVEMHTSLSPHPFVVDLAPGKYTITVERGKEYHPETRELSIDKEPVHLQLKMRRWIDLAKRGWYSGETHVHRPLEELPNLMLAEDLNVAFPLVHWVTEAFTPPRGLKPAAIGVEQVAPAKLIRVDGTHVIYPRNTEYEIFTVGKKRHTLGAFFVINHKSVFDKGVPPVGPIAQQAHAEDALIELDKPNWPWSMMLIAIMKVDLFELANNHVWRTEFGFPAFGEPAPDFMKIEKDARGFTEWGWLDFNFKSYYTLLNCGFRLRPTAGTASGVHPVPLGFGRVYVHLPNGFDYDAWVKGLNAGRSFVTTGPMLFAKVDGEMPGHVFRQVDAKKEYRVAVETVSAQPLDRIEIVMNGEIIQTLKPQNQPAQAGAFETKTDAKAPIDGTSWLAVRCFEKQPDKRVRFAHTAPFHFDVTSRPLRPKRAEIDFLVRRVEEQLKRNEDVLPEAALAEYREALRIFRKKGAE